MTKVFLHKRNVLYSERYLFILFIIIIIIYVYFMPSNIW